MTTIIKERPILFSARMVKAILDGDKTQTRRVVKFVESTLTPLGHVECARDGLPIWWDSPPPQSIRDSDYYDHGMPCPYGRPGDRLWVRESFWIAEVAGEGIGNAFLVYDDEIIGSEPMPRELRRLVSAKTFGHKPSIHMPRWASRITLEITDVRVEAVTSISYNDAKSEGVDSIEEFERLWKAINGESSWRKNVWVWALGFRVVSR